MYYFNELPSEDGEKQHDNSIMKEIKGFIKPRNTPEIATALGFLGFFMIQADVVLEYSKVSIPDALENGLVYGTGALFATAIGGAIVRHAQPELITEYQQPEPPISESE